MAEPGQKSGGCRNIAIGCGIAVLVVVIIGGVAGWYIGRNIKSWSAQGIAAVLESGIREMQLPADQEQRLLAKVDYLKNEFIAGNITFEQLGEIGLRLSEGTFFQAGMIHLAETQYIQPSGLSDEEKVEGSLAMQRILRGFCVDETISDQDIEEVMIPITYEEPDGTRQLKDNLTDDELRTFIDLAEEKADAAGVPDEPYKVDLAAEFERAIDEVLAGK